VPAATISLIVAAAAGRILILRVALGATKMTVRPRDTR
jgi:hypothetical protein